MIKQVLLPQVELSMESVTVTSWLVAEGDHVEVDQPILEVETQKASVEVPCPFEGYIRKLCVSADQEIGEKALLCIMTDTADEHVADQAEADDSSSEAPSTSPTKEVGSTASVSEPVPAGPVRSTPAARKAASSCGVDLSRLRGTGPGGRVTVEDVEQAATGGQDGPQPASTSWTDIPPTRLALIQQMQRSLAEIPQFHTGRRLDVSPLMTKLDGITFTHRLVKAAAAALARHPALCTIIDGAKTKTEPVSIALAMDTPHGLVAPVIRNADRLTLLQIAEQVRSLRDRGEANRLKREDLTNGPFAVSNLGMLGVDIFSPFVFHGQTAVLGIGRVNEATDGRKTAWFTLAVDHRVVDGADAARFLDTLQEECLKP